MKESKSYLEKLHIGHGANVKINGEDYKVQVKNTGSIIWLIGDVQKYIVDNISKLLILEPEFKDKIIQGAIERIKTRDKAITVLESELIGKGRPYMIVDGKVWRSSEGVVGSRDVEGNKTNTYYPSSELVTDDITNFVPINRHFSRDSTHVYSDYHRLFVEDRETFKAIGDTYYGYNDSGELYYDFNRVLGADITDGIIIISEEKGLIRDSSNNIFCGHRKVDVKNPEELSCSYGDFYYDGFNLYLLYAGMMNLTELYSEFEEGKDIVHLEGNKYKIGDKEFSYEDGKLRDLD